VLSFAFGLFCFMSCVVNEFGRMVIVCGGYNVAVVMIMVLIDENGGEVWKR
jgi:hypothetical protein